MFAPLIRLSLTLGLACLVTNVVDATTQQISLSGDDAEGYFALVGVNQEGSTTLGDISRDPTDPKFFDYPAYVSPTDPNNIWIMYVEPYMFGLDYPEMLHPTGPGNFVSVGTLQPAGTPGATFIEGVSEDADFGDFDIGFIEYDDASLTGVGTEFIPAASLSLSLDGTEFEGINRTDLASTPADVPPFGPDGRSNFNEAATSVGITALTATGTGLTFVDGVLESIDLTTSITVSVAGAAGQPGGNVTGSLTFDGFGFEFDVDGQASTFFAQDVRVLLNRSGTIDLPLLPGDYNRDGFVDGADYTFWANRFGGTTPDDLLADGNGDGLVDGADYTFWANRFGNTNNLTLDEIAAAFSPAAVPEPATVALLAPIFAGLLARRRA
ncbi:MAG: hypothetical protein AAF842_10000 [Planctomycetota bacterium]